ncbi:MAG TPA: TIGR00725 family protein [Acidimicrobiales bacterium]|nr:TIGR00725 family protein [Acidimicrobiales bacterium]
MSRAYVAVVGGGSAPEEQLRQAEAVGRAVADAGAVLVCGGLGGVMEAACRGARAGGGLTVGILPGRDRASANPYVDVAVPTGLGEARNALVVAAADTVVAVAGEFGTLSEIALALVAGTPVVGLGTWELARAGQPVDVIARADDPAGAVALALHLAAAAATAAAAAAAAAKEA